MCCSSTLLNIHKASSADLFCTSVLPGHLPCPLYPPQSPQSITSVSLRQRVFCSSPGLPLLTLHQGSKLLWYIWGSSHLFSISRITVLCCLKSSVLKTIVSNILYVLFCVCYCSYFRQETNLWLLLSHLSWKQVLSFSDFCLRLHWADHFQHYQIYLSQTTL